MNNGNMPAMPLNDIEIWIDPTDQSKGTIDATGLTKREHFAGLAMQGLISTYWNMTEEYSNPENLVKCLMETSVEHADALLKELDK